MHIYFYTDVKIKIKIVRYCSCTNATTLLLWPIIIIMQRRTETDVIIMCYI